MTFSDRGIAMQRQQSFRYRQLLALREFGQTLTDDRRLRDCGNKYPRGDVGDADEILEITRYCGRVWLCPVCGCHDASDRSRELGKILTAWTSQGGSLALLTLTQHHSLDDELCNLCDRLDHGWHTMVHCSGWQADKESFGVRGYVRVTEIVHHPERGWNPHFHIPLLLQEDRDEQLDDLKDRVAKRFIRGIKAAGGEASYDGQHIRPGSERELAEYCTKGTKLWRPKGSRTPMEILADLQKTGEGLDLWKEFSATVTGPKRRRYNPSQHIATLVR